MASSAMGVEPLLKMHAFVPDQVFTCQADLPSRILSARACNCIMLRMRGLINTIDTITVSSQHT